MPAITGLSPSCSAVLPIRPNPSARSVPRCRGDWPIALRTWVSLSRGNGGLLGRILHDGLLDRGLVGQHLADRLAARLGDVLGTAQVAQSRLGRLQHVDRIRGAERLRE